jgi:cytoskeletal protein CcmA (bactofilin family)
MRKFIESKWIRIATAVILLFALLFIPFTGVKAAGIDTDGNIGPNEVVNDDVLLQGNQVTMDGTINGSLLATANTITINGTVNGDAFLFGSTILISDSAKITGNVFVGAQTVNIAGEIGGSLAGGSSSLNLMSAAKINRNLYYGGFSLKTDPGTTVSTDIFTGNYQAILTGTVGRDINVGAAAVQIDGSIGRNANIDLGQANQAGSPWNYAPSTIPNLPTQINPGLHVAQTAKIGGKLTYTYSNNQDSNIQAVPQGGIVYQTPVPSGNQNLQNPSARTPRFTLWNLFFRPIFGYLGRFWRILSSLLILGALALWLIPSLFRRSIDQLHTSPGPSAGYGILVSIGGYIAAFFAALIIIAVGIILTAFTLGGLRQVTFGLGFAALGLAGAIFVMLIFFGSRLILAYLVGEWLVKVIAPNSTIAKQSFWSLAIGVLIYAILAAIPFVGWIFGLISTIFGMGALWLVYINWRKSRKPALMPVDTPAPPVQ